MKRRKKRKKMIDLFSIIMGIIISGIILYSSPGNLQSFFPEDLWASLNEQIAPDLECMVFTNFTVNI